MIHYWTLRPPLNTQHYKFRTSRHPQNPHMWTDRKKAIIVLDDEDSVIKGDINALKWSPYIYIYVYTNILLEWNILAYPMISFVNQAGNISQYTRGRASGIVMFLLLNEVPSSLHIVTHFES
jgi:hypothetical protein